MKKISIIAIMAVVAIMWCGAAVQACVPAASIAWDAWIGDESGNLLTMAGVEQTPYVWFKVKESDLRGYCPIQTTGYWFNDDVMRPLRSRDTIPFCGKNGWRSLTPDADGFLLFGSQTPRRWESADRSGQWQVWAGFSHDGFEAGKCLEFQVAPEPVATILFLLGGGLMGLIHRRNVFPS